MQKVRILFVITKLELGGAQKQLLSIISNLDQGQFQPFLFCANQGFLVEDARSIKGLSFFGSLFLERNINPIKDLLAFLQLCSFIKKNNIQIVHTHSSKAGILGRLAARICKVRAIIHTVHGFSFNSYQPFWKRTLFVQLERLCADFSDRIVVVSEHDRRFGLSLNIGTPEKYTLINYGINLDEFKSSAPDNKKELGFSPQTMVVGMVSCFKPQKNPGDFIRIAGAVKEKLSNVKFILAGDGVLRPRIERLIKYHKLEDDVLLLGWRRDISQVLSSLDIFVLTSLWEGLPIAALEAMASSVPVVATNTGGIKGIITDGENGFLEEPGSWQGMAGKVIELLRDPALRQEMGRKGKESLGEIFRLENMQKSYYNLYLELLAGRVYG